MEIIRGVKKQAIKCVIFGVEGIGKSTLASRFPDPLFIDTEGSTGNMDVARLPDPSSFAQLLSEVDYVKQHPEICRTLVIDTMDWAERLCVDQICASKKVSGIEDMPYGRGYVYVAEEIGRLLNRLEEIRQRGIHVVLTAHAQMRKFEQPDELGAYDRWELKMNKKTAPIVKEWADMILFCNYKTMVVNIDGQGAQKGKNKAQGGRRVMYTTHHACWDAKNRFGLPEELPMDYSAIAHVVEAAGSPQTAQTVKAPDPAPKLEKSRDESQAKPQIPVKPAPEPEPVQMDLTAMVEQAPDPVIPEPAKEAPAVSRYFSNPDKLPKALKDLMEQDDISEWSIQAAVMAKGYYPADTLIENMDPEFITGWIIAFWPQVKALIKEITEKEEVPFG